MFQPDGEPLPNLPTGIPGVELRELTVQDAEAFFDLVQRNRAFLTRYGDYTDLVTKTREEIARDMAPPPAANLRMGIWREGEFMGLVNLYEAAPGIFVLGFWLGEAFTGHGYMTAACQALMVYARRTHTGKQFWAGVRHANFESAAVMERLGFAVYEALPDRKRYWMACQSGGERP